MSNCAGVIKSAIADGPGVRVSVFLSGCPHQCPGCFNSEAWDYDYGTPLTHEAIEKVQSLLDHSFIQGLTLLGGEPLAPQNVKPLYGWQPPPKDWERMSGSTQAIPLKIL